MEIDGVVPSKIISEIKHNHNQWIKQPKPDVNMVLFSILVECMFLPDDRISESDFDFSILSYIHFEILIPVSQNLDSFHFVSLVLGIKVKVFEKIKPRRWIDVFYNISNVLRRVSLIIVHLVHSFLCNSIPKFCNFFSSQILLTKDFLRRSNLEPQFILSVGKVIPC